MLYIKFFFFNFIYLRLCWVFVPVRGLSLVAASGGHSSSRCAGLSLSRPLSLRSTGSRRAGSVVVAHGPSCSVVCGIFPDQGLNPCPLHWQADSQPLRHQGSPLLYINLFIYLFLAALGLRCCAQAFSGFSERGYSSLQCAGFSLQWLLLLRSTGSRCASFSSCGTWAQ